MWNLPFGRIGQRGVKIPEGVNDNKKEFKGPNSFAIRNKAINGPNWAAVEYFLDNSGFRL